MKIENCPFCDSEGVQIEPYGMVICSNEDCAMRESGAEFPPDMWNERPQCARFREKAAQVAEQWMDTDSDLIRRVAAAIREME